MVHMYTMPDLALCHHHHPRSRGEVSGLFQKVNQRGIVAVFFVVVVVVRTRSSSMSTSRNHVDEKVVSVMPTDRKDASDRVVPGFVEAIT